MSSEKYLSLSGVTTLVGKLKDVFSLKGHSHPYLPLSGGTVSGTLKVTNGIDGTVSEAEALTSSAGSATQPVYFSNGKPVATTYALNKTVPSSAVFTDTNTKMTQTVSTTSANYPLLLAPSGQTSTTTTTGYFGTKFQANPSTGVLTATTFSGALSGNATTATTATKLGSSTVGGAAKPIYLSSGTATACSSTVGSVTQPVYMNAGSITATSYSLAKSVPADAVFTDTTYDAATTSAAGLMSASDKTKLDGITSSADSVSFSQSLTSGTQVGTITINGTATKLYAPTNTDTKVTNTVGTANTAYLTGTTSSSTNTGTLVFDAAARLVGTTGTTSADGTARLILGNSTASGTAGNKRGWIRKYASGAYYLDTTPTVTANTTGYDVYRSSTAAVGSATQPMYVTATGALTACTYTLAKSVPSSAVFTDTTYDAITTSYVDGLF